MLRSLLLMMLSGIMLTNNSLFYKCQPDLYSVGLPIEVISRAAIVDYQGCWSNYATNDCLTFSSIKTIQYNRKDLLRKHFYII